MAGIGSPPKQSRPSPLVYLGCVLWDWAALRTLASGTGYGSAQEFTIQARFNHVSITVSPLGTYGSAQRAGVIVYGRAKEPVGPQAKDGERCPNEGFVTTLEACGASAAQ